MANASLPQYRFASIRRIQRWNQWKNRQQDKLERLQYLEADYWRRHTDVLSFKGWLRSWVNREAEVEREQILWEMKTIDRDIMELKRLIQADPNQTSMKWNYDPDD